MAAVTTDQVVAYLVAHNYLLTALELFLEACEAGREADVEPLHRFFKDPGRFPPEQVACFGPQEALSMQSVARQREERLALLGYELAVAKEDLLQLARGSQQAEHGTEPGGKPAERVAQQGTEEGGMAQGGPGPTPDGSSQPERQAGAGPAGEHAATGASRAVDGAQQAQQACGLSSSERRELLAAVRAFLAEQGYRLSAMTLAEECGGAMPRTRAQAPTAPSVTLAQYFKAQQAQQALQQQVQQAEQVAKAQAEEVAVLKHQVAEAQLQAEKERAARLTAEAELQFVQGKFRYTLAQQQLQSGAAAAAGPLPPLKGVQAERPSTVADEMAVASLAAVPPRTASMASASPSAAAAAGSARDSGGVREASSLGAAAAAAAALLGGASDGSALGRAQLVAAVPVGPSSSSSSQRPALLQAAALDGSGTLAGAPAGPPAGAAGPAAAPTSALYPTRKSSSGSENGSFPKTGALPPSVAATFGSLFATSQRQPNEEGGGAGAEQEYSVLGVEGALDEVANCLPSIIPNVLINKREELIPMLLAVCQEHPSPHTRRRTAALLFDLIKKPNSEQRALIATACMQLAKRIGPARASLEVLPHILSQTRHEYQERRIVVAEALGRLAPFLPGAELVAVLRDGISVLAADSHVQVRAVATVALGSLASALPDLEAFAQVQEVVLRLGQDPSQEVLDALLQQALPALLKRLGPSELIHTQLLPKVLSELQALLQRCPFQAGTDESALVSGTAVLRSLPDTVQRQAGVLLQVYMAALPALRCCALHAVPAWAAAWADRQVEGAAAPAEPAVILQQQQEGHPTTAEAAAVSDPMPAIANLGHLWSNYGLDDGALLAGGAPTRAAPLLPDGSSGHKEQCRRDTENCTCPTAAHLPLPPLQQAADRDGLQPTAAAAAAAEVQLLQGGEGAAQEPQRPQQAQQRQLSEEPPTPPSHHHRHSGSTSAHTPLRQGQQAAAPASLVLQQANGALAGLPPGSSGDSLHGSLSFGHLLSQQQQSASGDWGRLDDSSSVPPQHHQLSPQGTELQQQQQQQEHNLDDYANTSPLSLLPPGARRKRIGQAHADPGHALAAPQPPNPNPFSHFPGSAHLRALGEAVISAEPGSLLIQPAASANSAGSGSAAFPAVRAQGPFSVSTTTAAKRSVSAGAEAPSRAPTNTAVPTPALPAPASHGGGGLARSQTLPAPGGAGARARAAPAVPSRGPGFVLGSGPSISSQQLEAANAFSPLRRLPFPSPAAPSGSSPGAPRGAGAAPAGDQLSAASSASGQSGEVGRNSSVCSLFPSQSLGGFSGAGLSALQGPGGAAVSMAELSDASREGSATYQLAAAHTGHALPAVVRAQQRSLLWEAAALSAWAKHEGHAEWAAVQYLAAEAIPDLLRAAAMVSPTRDTLHLRRKLASALRAACLTFGPGFTQDVLEPLLLAASSAPDWRAPAVRCAAHVARVASQLAPSSPEAERAGRLTMLPLLLAGVLASTPSTADAADCVRRLVSDMGTGAVWALQHPQAFTEAVRFAADPPSLQAALLEVMWECSSAGSAKSRLAAALLAGALAPALHARQVSRQLLPAIVTLAGDRDAHVSEAGMAAAVEVFRAFPSDQPLQETLMGELEGVLAQAGHAAELALLRALGPLASSASEAQAQWLLQRAQLMLATMHQRAACGRTPGQLAEAASVLFDTLRLVEAHEFTTQQGALHFAAALQALQREADLLEPPQRDALAAMLADHCPAMEGRSQRPGSAGGGNSGAQPTTAPGGRSAALPAGLTLSTLTHHMPANQAGQQGYAAGAANGGFGGVGGGTAGPAGAAAATGAGLGKEGAAVGRLQQGGGAPAAAGSSWTLFRGWQRQDS